jgi:superfamily II DNA or RNA helicase
MNDREVYGKIIFNVPAPELIANGSILPPKINAMNIGSARDKDQNTAERDCMTLLDTILNEEHMDKVLVAAPNTKVLIRMIAETNFMTEVQSYGYDVLWITAKYGAFINNIKISREEFFNKISDFGKDPNKKFIVLHYSILSEGISVPGLTSLIMMRQMNVIEMCQSIGRVIRLHLDDIKGIQSGQIKAGDLDAYTKSFGLIHVPVYSNTGISTVRRLQSVVDTVFVEGEPAISVIKK